MSEEGQVQKKEPRWVKFITEHLPLLLFLLAYIKGDLNLAIKVIVVATAIALVISLIAVRRVPILPMLVAGSVLLFGGVSVWLDDPNIYKIKPTVLNTLFGVVLLGGMAFKQLFLKSVMGDSLALPDEAWRTLTVRYSVLFFVLATLNEVVWRTQTEAFWVGFKLGGPLVLIVIFTLAHLPFFQKHGLQ
jgi:intracellular septation protein